MRLDPASTAHAELVAQQWGRWFGSVSPAAFTELEWENGFVSRATIRAPLAESLFTLRVMRFARELSISMPFGAPLTGLDSMLRLRHLSVSLSGPVALSDLQPTFEKLASIELQLSGSAAVGPLPVLAWPLPALRRFILDVERIDRRTLAMLCDAPWLRQLESLTLCAIDGRSAELLLNRSQMFGALGANLHLDLSVSAPRDEIRRNLPHATLRQRDPMSRLPFRERGPWPIAQPRDAPANYLSFPPQLTPLGDVFVSSGAQMRDPFTDLPEARACAWCASNSTLVIFAQVDGRTPHGRARWIREWRCEECGGLSSSRRPAAR